MSQTFLIFDGLGLAVVHAGTAQTVLFVHATKRVDFFL